MQKRYVAWICCLLSLLLLFVACRAEEPKNPSATKGPGKIQVAALKGPTGIGMSKLMKDKEAGVTANQYQFTLAGSPDEITGKLLSGEIKVAALPTNLALNLYNKSNGKVQLAALNTLGVLSILEKGNTIQSVADLEGKTIYATGQGSTPQYVLEYILETNQINATVEYVSEHSELATKALAGQADVVLLPEPFVTKVLKTSKEFRLAIDVTEAFEESCTKAGKGGTTLTMGCLVVNTEFAKNHKAAFDTFLEEYKASAEYVVNSAPVVAPWLVKYGIMEDSALAEKAIPNCNIVYIDGTEMVEKVAGFYQLLFDSNPNSVGGALPDEGFYYKK